MVPEGGVRTFDVDGAEVGVLHVLGQWRAFENHCPHQGGPVCMGSLLGRQEAVLDGARRIVGERFSEERFDVVCPWHGYAFDALSGECVGDRRLRLRHRPISIRDGQIYISASAR